MKTISRISMVAFLLAAPFLFYGFGLATFRNMASFSFGEPRWTSFAAGAAVFVPCLFIGRGLMGAAWSWLETFEHELTHLIFGLLFLKLPVGFKVSAHSGGEVRHVGRGTTGQTWITLAPYFFPTVSIFVVIAAWLANLNSNYLLGALGWATAFHLVSSWTETSFRQPDLKKAGILKTLLILPVMNLICYGAVIAFVAGGGNGFGEFWISGIKGAWKLVAGIVNR